MTGRIEGNRPGMLDVNSLGGNGQGVELVKWREEIVKGLYEHRVKVPDSDLAKRIHKDLIRRCEKIIEQAIY